MNRQFIVACHEVLEETLGDDEDSLHSSRVTRLVTCESLAAVSAATAEIVADGLEWSVFETVGCGWEPRTVCFDHDGNAVSIQ